MHSANRSGQEPVPHWKVLTVATMRWWAQVMLPIKNMLLTEVKSEQFILFHKIPGQNTTQKLS